jgi:hypothetical protein
MFRGPTRDAPRADVEAVGELIARCRRLSRVLFVVALVAALGFGVGSVALALRDYVGPGGKYLGARIGWTFALGAGCSLWLAMAVRTRLVRRALARWIGEMASRGMDPRGLADEVEAFVPAVRPRSFWRSLSRSFDHRVP